jgi:hypothetical protein
MTYPSVHVSAWRSAAARPDNWDNIVTHLGNLFELENDTLDAPIPSEWHRSHSIVLYTMNNIDK